MDVVLANEEEAQAFSCIAPAGGATAGAETATSHAASSSPGSQPQCTVDGRGEAAETAGGTASEADSAQPAIEPGSATEEGVRSEPYPAAPPGVQQAQDLLLRHCRVSAQLSP